MTTTPYIRQSRRLEIFVAPALAFEFSPFAYDRHEKAHMVFIDNPVREAMDMVSGTNWTPRAYRAGYMAELLVGWRLAAIFAVLSPANRPKGHGMPLSGLGIHYAKSVLDMHLLFLIGGAILTLVLSPSFVPSTWCGARPPRHNRGFASENRSYETIDNREVDQ